MSSNEIERPGYRPGFDTLREWVIQLSLLTMIVSVPVVLAALVAQIIQLL